ncbi:hypothetical protein BLNAU_2069 [Blattamonas nauphoetae]|uniref:Uncharacterized protein n=1 Tax=Blattamonas nauphoetae TaxID=2049346 RepID=A0ABQ9YH10_9EUKA|nr:hypothetical protein BLNAU_2069 [Blattamonas nauphoetae]
MADEMKQQEESGEIPMKEGRKQRGANRTDRQPEQAPFKPSMISFIILGSHLINISVTALLSHSPTLSHDHCSSGFILDLIFHLPTANRHSDQPIHDGYLKAAVEIWPKEQQHHNHLNIKKKSTNG